MMKKRNNYAEQNRYADMSQWRNTSRVPSYRRLRRRSAPRPASLAHASVYSRH
jgi:hypothetical protein